MNNPQKFSIINPRRGTCEAHYEGAGLPPMWQRCLRYRPRVKDFRVLRLPVDKICRMRRSVDTLWSPTPCDVQAKSPMSLRSDARRALKASNISIKAAQTPGPDRKTAPHSVKSIKPNLPKYFDSLPLHTSIKDLEVNEASGELTIGTALSSADVTHSVTRPSSKQLYSNHQIGMALTTTQIVSNYSRPQQYIHHVGIQEKGNNAVRDDVRSDDTLLREILPVKKDICRFKPQESTGAGLVDISTFVPDYPVPKRKAVTPKRLEDGIQYQPLPRLSSTQTLVQELEVDAFRLEQDRLIQSRYQDEQKSGTLRNLRRDGQIWDGEETRNNFLAIEALAHSIRLT